MGFAMCENSMQLMHMQKMLRIYCSSIWLFMGSFSAFFGKYTVVQCFDCNMDLHHNLLTKGKAGKKLCCVLFLGKIKRCKPLCSNTALGINVLNFGYVIKTRHIIIFKKILIFLERLSGMFKVMIFIILLYRN